ncbi:unnamed protein product, partial [Prorocentrum cordatum]
EVIDLVNNDGGAVDTDGKMEAQAILGYRQGHVPPACTVQLSPMAHLFFAMLTDISAHMATKTSVHSFQKTDVQAVLLIARPGDIDTRVSAPGIDPCVVGVGSVGYQKLDEQVHQLAKQVTSLQRPAERWTFLKQCGISRIGPRTKTIAPLRAKMCAATEGLTEQIILGCLWQLVCSRTKSAGTMGSKFTACSAGPEGLLLLSLDEHAEVLVTQVDSFGDEERLNMDSDILGRHGFDRAK